MGADRSTALVPRILHTADWQIGKPYRWVDDGQKQARLQQERVEVVGRIAEIVRQERLTWFWWRGICSIPAPFPRPQ